MTAQTFKHLIRLFDLMDSAWDKTAESYRFQCNGCRDNCCKSLFFHHTYIEKAYLLHGFNMLDHNKKKMILNKAEEYCNKTFNQTGEAKSLKLYCPLNEDNRCLLYQYRPMICRLHGLPHELNRPGFKSFKGAGCKAGKFHEKPYIKFDRTPFYQTMAQIESDFRRDLNKTEKIRESIAQMLISQ